MMENSMIVLNIFFYFLILRFRNITWVTTIQKKNENLANMRCIVHPNKYAHDSYFVLYCGLVKANFAHIRQGHFTDTGAILWLILCQWSNPEEYG